jgi:nucleoside-diphosphate-sugar epimerase
MTNGLTLRRVALIGGAGFIGHTLALELNRRGAHVEVVDSLQVNNLLSFALQRGQSADRALALRILNDRLDLLRAAGIVLHPQDARDYHALSRILAEIEPQVVVQLAAVSHAGRSNKDPYSTFDHSLRTLENALDFARSGAEHFVFLSSSMVYGNFQTAEVTEDHPLNPIGIYGALKLGGEKLVIAYEQVFGLSYTIVRPSALYGPRCVSRRVGQIFVEQALAGQPLKVNGDGDDRLDFTYVDDLVVGICQVIEHPAARNETFNLTYGSARSIADVIEVLRRRFPGLTLERVERDSLMPRRGTLSVDKARRLIGYDPRTPIEVGFDKYIAWYRELMRMPDTPVIV